MNVTENVSNGIGGAFAKVTSSMKNILAANNAHRANEALQDAKDAKEGKVHGTIYNTVETIGDAVMDVTNVATLGVARRIGNIIDDKDSKIDYKALKKAKKSKEINNTSSIQDRASYLINDSIENQIVGNSSDDFEP